MLKENNEQHKGIWKTKRYGILSSVCRCGMSMRLWVQILLEAHESTEKKIINCWHQYTYIVAVNLPKLSSCRNRITPEQSQLQKKLATFAAFTTSPVFPQQADIDTMRLTDIRSASRIGSDYSNIEATDFNI
jgi:fumarylacetoacetate (FAA) hydrolase family protein